MNISSTLYIYPYNQFKTEKQSKTNNLHSATLSAFSTESNELQNSLQALSFSGLSLLKNRKALSTIVSEQIDKLKLGSTKWTDDAIWTRHFVYKPVKGDRIQVAKYHNTNVGKPIELPEYLYHITSTDAFNEIQKTGQINISTNEQLTGIFLLDKKNFLEHYSSTKTKKFKKRDLMTAIFVQAGKRANTENNPLSKFNISIIRIPTIDLLEKGKFRVRTQKDFFDFDDVLSRVSKQTGEKFCVRNMRHSETREKFKNMVVSNGIMTDEQARGFLKEMTQKLHQGFTLQQMYDLAMDKKQSVEYIYNDNIRLSDFPSIRTKRINLLDYFAEDGVTVDPSKIKNIFE